MAIAVLDTTVVVAVALTLFDVPFNGSVWVFALGAVLFLFTALGLGVLISTVSQTHGLGHVSVRFGDRVALADVSLDVPGATITAVVGGDGAGKTTLLRALAGRVALSRGRVRRPPSCPAACAASWGSRWRPCTSRSC